MKRKQFIKGINQLSEEGTIQVFKQIDIGFESIIVGVVGILQLEVLGVQTQARVRRGLRIQKLPHRHARWIVSSDTEPRNLTLTSTTMIVHDQDERYVLLFENEWSIRWSEEKKSFAET